MQCSKCGQAMTRNQDGWWICYACGNSSPGIADDVPTVLDAVGSGCLRVVPVHGVRIRNHRGCRPVVRGSLLGV